MARVFEGDAAECERVRDLGSKLLGYPRAGAHQVRPRHVVLGAPPPVGEEKAGWTSWDTGPEPVFEEPSGNLIGFRQAVDPYESELVAEDARPARDKRLTASERTEIGARLAEATERLLAAVARR
jgi:hypothetical protein